MSLLYLLPAVIILILIFPTFLEVRVSFNPLFNKGVVALFVFKFKLFHYVFSFNKNMIELENEDKHKTTKLDFEGPELAVMEEFMKQLKDKIRLKKCYVFYNIGFSDAFLSAMFCGFLNQVLTQIFVNIKSKKPTASLCIFDNVSFNRTVFEIAGRVLISVSLFEVVYSYIYSVIITKKKK